jgi:hypothetical protein
MPVFNAYLKIIRKNAPLLIMYLGIVARTCDHDDSFECAKSADGFCRCEGQDCHFQ